MGFFEEVGRKVEEFKQEAQRAAEREAARVCENCGEEFYTARETCPECGSDDVTPID